MNPLSHMIKLFLLTDAFHAICFLFSIFAYYYYKGIGIFLSKLLNTKREFRVPK